MRKLQLAFHYCLILHNKSSHTTQYDAINVPDVMWPVASGRRRHQLFAITHHELNKRATGHIMCCTTQRKLSSINAFVHEFQHIYIFYNTL